MKKSKIITKIMLAFVMVSLIFALAACGESSSGSKKGGGKKDDKKTQLTLSEHLGNIAGTVDGLLVEVSKIPESKAAYISLDVGVEYANFDEAGATKTSEGKYTLGISGNIREEDPELDITFKAPNGNTKEYEWFRLAVKNSTLFLEQPLTAVNTAATVDRTSMDVTALEPAINDLMFVAIDAVSGFVTDSKIGTDAGFKLSSMIGGIDSTILDALGGVLVVKETKTGWTISASNKLWGTISGFSGMMGAIGDLVPGLINSLLGEQEAQRPTLDITITKNGNVLSGLSIGYEFTNGNYGKVVLDLALSTTNPVSITAPNYGDDALHANLTATAAQKGLKAALDAYLNANLIADEGNFIGYATLVASAVDGTDAQTAYGIVKDGMAAFDLAPIFAKLGGTTENATNYKANIQSATEEKNADGVLQSISDMTFPTIVECVNDWAADFKADYIANKGKEKEETSTDGTRDNPKRGILVKIYAWLVGEENEATALRKLGTTVDGDVYTYNDPTEQDMMKALKDKIGDYVNFEIDVSGATKNTYNNYLNTVKNIAKLIGDNDEWIVGFDLIDSDNLMKNIASWKDFTSFDKWLAGSDFSSISAWAASLDIPERDENGYGKFGIVDWNTSKGPEGYRGGLVVYAEGGQNDLLDLVNVFVKVPHEFDENDKPVAESFSAITVADVAKLLNNNICKAAKYFGVTVEEGYAFDNYQTNVNLTNQIVHKAIGYTMTSNDADGIVSELIHNGLYLEIGSESGKGIYGFIAIYDIAATHLGKGNTQYAKLEGSINFVENTVENDAKAVEDALLTEDTVSLNAAIGEDGAVVTEEIEGGIKVVYPNAQECLDMLYDLWEAYVAFDAAE